MLVLEEPLIKQVFISTSRLDKIICFAIVIILYVVSHTRFLHDYIMFYTRLMSLFFYFRAVSLFFPPPLPTITNLLNVGFSVFTVSQ